MQGKAKTVQEYISARPAQAQQRLRELRDCLKHADPTASEELKWGKPAFVNNGILYVYAAAKNHISLHPTPSVMDHFREELKSFTLSGNTIQFPLDHPIPRQTVLKLAALRVHEKNEKGIGWK